MVRALARTIAPRGLIRALGRCTTEECGANRCREGCHHGQRGLRLTLIPQADELLRARPGPLLAPTLVHPLWEVPYEDEPEAISIPAVKQQVKRGFMRLTACTGKHAMVVGAFEVCLNRALQGVKT